MTIEILNRYRANSDWCTLINRLDGQLFALKKIESDLVNSDVFECPTCLAPVCREDKICPFCRSPLPEREEKGTWRRVRPTEHFLEVIDEAWTTYCELLRVQRTIDIESDANSTDEKLRKSIAMMQSGSLDLLLGTGPDDVVIAARHYETYVADYLLGVVEERYSIPFEAIRKSRASSDDLSEMIEKAKKLMEGNNR